MTLKIIVLIYFHCFVSYVNHFVYCICWMNQSFPLELVKRDTHWARRRWEWLQTRTSLSGIWRCSKPRKTEREPWMCLRQQAENMTKSAWTFAQTYRRIKSKEYWFWHILHWFKMLLSCFCNPLNEWMVGCSADNHS